MLDRNWAHWTTFSQVRSLHCTLDHVANQSNDSQDVCWSLYVGRDFSVPAPSDRKNIPVPFVDSDFDQMPWHYPQSKLSPQPNFLSKIFSGSCELLIIARRIMDVVYVGWPSLYYFTDALVTGMDSAFQAPVQRFITSSSVVSSELQRYFFFQRNGLIITLVF